MEKAHTGSRLFSQLENQLNDSELMRAKIERIAKAHKIIFDRAENIFNTNEKDSVMERSASISKTYLSPTFTKELIVGKNKASISIAKVNCSPYVNLDSDFRFYLVNAGIGLQEDSGNHNVAWMIVSDICHNTLGGFVYGPGVAGNMSHFPERDNYSNDTGKESIYFSNPYDLESAYILKLKEALDFLD